MNADISTTYSGETGITLAAGNSVFINSGIDSLSAPNSRWLVYGVSEQHNEMDGVTSDFHRYSCVYGIACVDFPTTGNGFLYSVRPKLIITQTDDGYELTGYRNNDEMLDTISGTLETGLSSLLGYGFILSDSTGSSLQGSMGEELGTPQPESQTISDPTTPVTPTTPIFEAHYQGRITASQSDLPNTIQPLSPLTQTHINNQVTLSYDLESPLKETSKQNMNGFDMCSQPSWLCDAITQIPFQIMPPNLSISSNLLKYFGLSMME